MLEGEVRRKNKFSTHLTPLQLILSSDKIEIHPKKRKNWSPKNFMLLKVQAPQVQNPQVQNPQVFLTHANYISQKIVLKNIEIRPLKWPRSAIFIRNVTK